MLRTSNITRLQVRDSAAHLASSVAEHLEQLLSSPQFDASARSRDFLRFVVNETLVGRGERLDQAAIAIGVFGRNTDFDPVLDPIVRVQAGRLRRSLERYYLLTNNVDSLRIDLPRGSYRPAFVPASETPRKADTILTTAIVTPPPCWPCVLIRPFAQSGAGLGDTDVRVEDEVTHELCRYGDIRVVRERDLEGLDPRHRAGIRFELQGHVRKAGEDHLVAAFLVDRTTGQQLWSEEYRTGPRLGRWGTSVDDIACIVAARIGAEHGVILRTLATEYRNAPSPRPEALESVLQCHRFFVSRKVDELAPAIHAMQDLTRREPDMASAWCHLARLYTINHTFELSALHTPMDAAIQHAYQASLLDPTAARTRCVLAAALLIRNELGAARDVLEHTLRLSDHTLAYRDIVGWLLALAGDWERGIAVMQDAMDRNPYCMPHVNHGLWANHLRSGNYQAAYLAALEYRDPCFFWRELMVTSCLGHLGRLDEARTSGLQLLQKKPEFESRGRTLIGHYIKSDDLCTRIVDGLRMADIHLR